MDVRHDEAQHTGTLPVAGDNAVPLAERPPAPQDRPAWVDEARRALEAPGRYLAYEEGDRRVVVAIAQQWTRIGRSLSADIRFDDATVSRRHAQIVDQGAEVRVLDDRSLNGIAVNGRRVESSPLADGDQISIGRHTLHYIELVPAGAAVGAAPGVAAD